MCSGRHCRTPHSNHAASLLGRPVTSWRAGHPRCESTPAGNGPTPAPQLTLFEAEEGWRYSLWVSGRRTAPGWPPR